MYVRRLRYPGSFEAQDLPISKDRIKDKSKASDFIGQNALPLTIGGLYFLVSLWQLSGVLFTGDSAVYNQQVENFNLSIRSGHFGYYLMGILFNVVSPFSTEVTMNLLSMVCSSLALVLVFFLAERTVGQGDGRKAGVFAAVSLAGCSMFGLHAIFSHYFMLQTTLVLLAYLLWSEERPVLSGLSMLLALLVSPLSALSIPGLLLGTFQLRKVALWALTVFPAYGSFLWIFRENFFMGNRGIFASGIRDASDNVSLPFSVLRMGYHLTMNFNIFLLFAMLGLVIGVLSKRGRVRRFCWATMSVVLLFLVFGVTNHHIWFHLPFYPMIACLAGIGFSWLASRPRFLGREYLLAAVAIFGVVFGWFLSMEKKNEMLKTRAFYLEVGAALPEEALVVTDWSRGMRYEKYNLGTTYTGTWKQFECSASVAGGMLSHGSSPKLPLLGSEGSGHLQREVWMLDPHTAGRVKKCSGYSLTERRFQNGKVWILGEIQESSTVRVIQSAGRVEKGAAL